MFGVGSSFTVKLHLLLHIAMRRGWNERRVMCHIMAGGPKSNWCCWVCLASPCIVEEASMVGTVAHRSFVLLCRQCYQNIRLCHLFAPSKALLGIAGEATARRPIFSRVSAFCCKSYGKAVPLRIRAYIRDTRGRERLHQGSSLTCLLGAYFAFHAVLDIQLIPF